MFDARVSAPLCEHHILRGRERPPVKIENEVERALSDASKRRRFLIQRHRINNPDVQPVTIPPTLKRASDFSLKHNVHGKLIASL